MLILLQISINTAASRLFEMRRATNHQSVPANAPAPHQTTPSSRPVRFEAAEEVDQTLSSLRPVRLEATTISPDERRRTPRLERQSSYQKSGPDAPRAQREAYQKSCPDALCAKQQHRYRSAPLLTFLSAPLLTFLPAPLLTFLSAPLRARAPAGGLVNGAPAFAGALAGASTGAPTFPWTPEDV